MLPPNNCNVRHPFGKLMFQQKVLLHDAKHTARKNAWREINTMQAIYNNPHPFRIKKKANSSAQITLAYLYVFAMHRLYIAKVLVDTKIPG